MNVHRKIAVFMGLLTLTAGIMVQAQDVTLDFRCYQDGTECDVYTDLLARFSEESGINVEVSVVPYTNIDEQLPIQVEAGQAPDMARITNFAAYAGKYFDATSYLTDEQAEAWATNYPAPVLAAMGGEDGAGLGGFPDAFTVTGPFVNVTLFELAGVALPDTATATWEDYTDAAAQVQAALNTEESPVYAIAIDRTGHRFAGPAMTMGATLINDEGMFTVDTPGFRAMAELLNRWHVEGLTPAEVWLGSGGSFAQAADYFINGQLAVYESGSWQVNRFATEIGDNFDWVAVPNPQGEGDSTGVAGGAAVVGFAQTQHPEELAQVFAYLTSPEVASEFSARTNSLSANRTVASEGVEFTTDNPVLVDALTVFGAEVPKLQNQAAALNVHPFAFAYYRNSANRITQYLVGELPLEEALAGLQKDIDDIIATDSQ